MQSVIWQNQTLLPPKNPTSNLCNKKSRTWRNLVNTVMLNPTGKWPIVIHLKTHSKHRIKRATPISAMHLGKDKMGHQASVLIKIWHTIHKQLELEIWNHQTISKASSLTMMEGQMAPPVLKSSNFLPEDITPNLVTKKRREWNCAATKGPIWASLHLEMWRWKLTTATTSNRASNRQEITTHLLRMIWNTKKHPKAKSRWQKSALCTLMITRNLNEFSISKIDMRLVRHWVKEHLG